MTRLDYELAKRRQRAKELFTESSPVCAAPVKGERENDLKRLQPVACLEISHTEYRKMLRQHRKGRKK